MAGQHRDRVESGRGWNTPRVRRALGMGALTGVVSAFPFWRIPRKPLMLVSGLAAAAITTAAVVLARDQAEREATVQGERLPEATLAKRVGGPVLAGALGGGAMAGTMWLTSVTDEWSEKLVAKLGARHPRATYAVIAGVGTAVIEYFDSGVGPKGVMTAPSDRNTAAPQD